jgi:indole-3-glycerol phosphate synthase
VKTILQQIIDNKKEIVAKNKELIPLDKIYFYLKKINYHKRNFTGAIEDKIKKQKPAIIAEVKKASPSKGVICKNFKPVEIAKNYEKFGATCISVLTDEKYFMGKNEYLIEIKKNTSLPILRKDFIIDEYQIWESKLIGADCILLIMSALELEQAKKLEKAAIKAGLDILIEIHNEQELHNATKLQSKLIGINNRNLKDLSVDLKNSLQIQSLIPNNKIIICESGINSIEDFNIMQKEGFKAFLIGEFLSKNFNNIKLLNI